MVWICTDVSTHRQTKETTEVECEDQCYASLLNHAFSRHQSKGLVEVGCQNQIQLTKFHTLLKTNFYRSLSFLFFQCFW